MRAGHQQCKDNSGVLECLNDKVYTACRFRVEIAFERAGVYRVIRSSVCITGGLVKPRASNKPAPRSQQFWLRERFFTHETQLAKRSMLMACVSSIQLGTVVVPFHNATRCDSVVALQPP
jgi:hypothetical protein